MIIQSSFIIKESSKRFRICSPQRKDIVLTYKFNIRGFIPLFPGIKTLSLRDEDFQRQFDNTNYFTSKVKDIRNAKPIDVMSLGLTTKETLYDMSGLYSYLKNTTYYDVVVYNVSYETLKSKLLRKYFEVVTDKDTKIICIPKILKPW